MLNKYRSFNTLLKNYYKNAKHEWNEHAVTVIWFKNKSTAMLLSN